MLRTVRVAAALAPAVLLTGCGKTSEEPQGCVVPDVCPDEHRSVSPSGFTDNTGWHEDHCCNICEDAKRVNCLDPATCGQKTGDDDWDFLVFDQIWLPQLCAAWDQGHDPTLTHAPGSRCDVKARRRSGLSIHGLWPNYVGGWPQCCRHTKVRPSDLPADLQLLAEQQWVDPAWRDGDGCSFCSMWGHEYMKHGTCLAETWADYFNVTLALDNRMAGITKALEGMLAKAGGHVLPTDHVAAAFAPFQVQVVCDPHDPLANSTVGVFLELRTCWQRGPGFSMKRPLVEDLVQVNCSQSSPTCPDSVLVRLPDSGLAVVAV